MKLNPLFKFFFVLAFSFSCTTTFSAVNLPALFTDGMVLQQKAQVNIWGKANYNVKINIITSWDKRQYQITSNNNGDWDLTIKTPSFGGPYQIDITDGKMISLKNILIGDVWICSGQSNMEMPLAGWGKVMNYEKEISNADYPEIRLLQLEHVTSNSPLNDVKLNNGGTWRVCSPQSVAEFSSTAYFFAREIYEKTKIPIGLIHSSWGGTIAEAWTSGSSLKKMPEFVNAVKGIEDIAANTEAVPYIKKMELWLDKANKADEGIKNGQPVWINSVTDIDTWYDMPVSKLWEETVLPNFDGIVWLKKDVEIPGEMAGSELTLYLGTIDDNDVTFFNGEKVGETQGYNQNRAYKIPARLVKAGINTITVRVFDSGGGGGMYGMPEELKLISKNEMQISLSGNWKYKVGLDLKEFEPMPVSDQSANRPTVLYNAMIHPLTKFKIKGAIWYQGEANVDRAEQYATLFPLLIKDWREKWNEDFPFYFVQLANFLQKEEKPVLNSNWAALRDAQRSALKLTNTGMAVITDIGEANDIHPKNKQEVGRRLALIALNKQYNILVEYSGPILKDYKTKGAKVILKFSHADGMKHNGIGFAVAGENEKLTWANAVVKNNKVIVSNDLFKEVLYIYYNWANNPDGLLTNSSGLPASGFRFKVK